MANNKDEAVGVDPPPAAVQPLQSKRHRVGMNLIVLHRKSFYIRLVITNSSKVFRVVVLRTSHTGYLLTYLEIDVAATEPLAA